MSTGTTRRLLLCFITLLAVTPLLTLGAPVKAKASAVNAASTSAQPQVAPAQAGSSSGAAKKKKKELCGDGKEGPCICDGVGGTSFTLRKKSIGTNCNRVSKAFYYVDPADKTSAKTGDLEFITGASAISAAEAKTKKAGNRGKNCDHIVELQFVKEEIDKIKTANPTRHSTICAQLRTDTRLFNALNSDENVMFVEGEVNGAKLVPVGGGSPGSGTTAQAARGAIAYIEQVLSPTGSVPSSDTAARKIEKAMTDLMASINQAGFDPGFATRWEQRLKDSIVKLKAAPNVKSLSSTSATPAPPCPKRKATSPPGGSPAKKTKTRALLAFFDGLVRRVTGTKKVAAPIPTTDSCPLPDKSTTKGGSSTSSTGNTAVKAPVGSKATATAGKITAGKTAGTAVQSGKQSTTKSAPVKSAGKKTTKPATKVGTASKTTSKAATGKSSVKTTTKPATKKVAAKPVSKTTVASGKKVVSNPTAKKVATKSPAKAASKPKTAVKGKAKKGKL